jgi:hypothetical protein
MHYPSIGTMLEEAFRQFLLKTRVVFPSVSCWQIDVGTGLKLAEGTLVPEMNFSFITSLAIVQGNEFRCLYDGFVKRRFTSLWTRFPLLKHLTLGDVWLGGLERSTFIELNWDVQWRVSDPKKPVEFLEQLIHYLGNIATAEDGTSLEELVLQDFELNPNLLTALRNFLDSRSRFSCRSGETSKGEPGELQGCRVTFRRSRLCESELDPGHFVQEENWTAPPTPEN